MNTIPGMPCINHDQYDIDGIRVERFTTALQDATQRPPLILRARWLPRIVELARTRRCLRGRRLRGSRPQLAWSRRLGTGRR